VLPLSLGLGLLLLLSLLCCVGLGAAGAGWAEVLRFLWAGLTGGTVQARDAASYTIVWEIRLPRVVLGAVVGAGLAAVGVAVQAMVRNALADPFVLGISSGAAVGADAVILLGRWQGSGCGRFRSRRSPRRSRPWRWCTPWPARRTA
jgi:iron complex transport system permease protein